MRDRLAMMHERATCLKQYLEEQDYLMPGQMDALLLCDEVLEYLKSIGYDKTNGA